MPRTARPSLLLAVAFWCLPATVLAAPASSPPAQAQSAPVGSTASSAWSIKGIGLGTTVDAFKAAFPDGNCTTFSDPKILSCVAQTTLADQPAMMHVKFLDGLSCYVALEKITWGQAQAGARALLDKYGPPTRQDTYDRRVLTEAGGNDYVTATVPVWVDGNAQLYPALADYTDAKRHITYSSITLVDVHKHNDEWIVRYNNKTPAKPGDI